MTLKSSCHVDNEIVIHEKYLHKHITLIHLNIQIYSCFLLRDNANKWPCCLLTMFNNENVIQEKYHINTNTRWFFSRHVDNEFVIQEKKGTLYLHKHMLICLELNVEIHC